MEFILHLSRKFGSSTFTTKRCKRLSSKGGMEDHQVVQAIIPIKIKSTQSILIALEPEEVVRVSRLTKSQKEVPLS
jgi:hypothetical protein